MKLDYLLNKSKTWFKNHKDKPLKNPEHLLTGMDDYITQMGLLMFYNEETLPSNWSLLCKGILNPISVE